MNSLFECINTTDDNCFRREAKMKNRKYPRLKNYDYKTTGAYFITLVCHQRLPLFGRISSGTFHPTLLGETTWYEWNNLTCRYPSWLRTDAFVLMPNHLHGILWLLDGCPRSVSDIIGLFKSGVTRQFHLKIWQRSFYDRVIRDEYELLKIREYIQNNPLQWALDRLYIP
ncbi:hypothetical protein CUN67_12285 [Pantoea cypripedii]|uniref:Transposase IS200-like domain-containing protein n=2 Tax=Pantoea cypripedii TaxID=55209 RepID=A0A6B9GB75_PANCY|nr:hypothetical protein CUN67_12285 [Pantoea cypripedii]